MAYFNADERNVSNKLKIEKRNNIVAWVIACSETRLRKVPAKVELWHLTV